MRAELDLMAQQTMAYWAKAMFWTTVASIVLSIGALIGLFVSLAQTARALKDSRTNSEIQNQAYAYVESLEYGTVSAMVATCKNSGLTPATHFSISAKAQLLKPGAVSTGANFDNSGLKTWSRIGPGEAPTVALDVEHSDIVARFIQGDVEPDDLLVISGTLVYCTIYNHDHETQFLFYVDQKHPKRFRRPTANLRTFHRLENPAKAAVLSATPPV